VSADYSSCFTLTAAPYPAAAAPPPAAAAAAAPLLLLLLPPPPPLLLLLPLLQPRFKRPVAQRSCVELIKLFGCMQAALKEFLILPPTTENKALFLSRWPLASLFGAITETGDKLNDLIVRLGRCYIFPSLIYRLIAVFTRIHITLSFAGVLAQSCV
jgi:hypothetical protein